MAQDDDARAEQESRERTKVPARRGKAAEARERPEVQDERREEGHQTRERTKVPARRGKGAEPNVAELLRFAFEADPSSDEGSAALDVAQTAALRLARDLKRQARVVGGKQAATFERRANQAYYQAVLADQLPRLQGRLAELADQPRIVRSAPEVPDEPSAQPVSLTAPDAPTAVLAEAGIASATVRWTPPAQVVTSYTVTPLVGETAQTPTVVSGTLDAATILGLTPGTSYRFHVVATNLIGDSAPSELSNEITVLGLPTDTTEPIELDLPAFSSDPALLIDPEADAARRLLASATSAGSKWRYEHLEQQAVSAAKDTLRFEQHIVSMMSLAMDKLGTSEELLGDSLLAAVDDLKAAGQQLADIGGSPEIDDLVEPLGQLSAESLLLPRFVAWLVEVGPVNFWVGLFEAMINDLASVVPFFGDATDFGRTKRYLDDAFADDVDGVRAAMEEAARSVLDRLDADVDEMIAPLRAAVGKVIGGTRAAMADVFEASDLVLLMTPASTSGDPHVPDLDPFEELYERLEAEVDALAGKVKDKIRDALEPLLDGGSDLFRTLVITFLVIPLLAFLVIALAGGPFSAALLAAIVLVAAEELIRLLVRWLTGPLLGRVDELKREVVELVGQLQGFFSEQAGIVTNHSPEVVLRIVASQLRQVSDFLPQQFLEETAAVLEEARNVVLRTATQLGLAAEHALGAENATAFDALDLDYATHLAPAPQLPGGRDPERLAGAALLRDLGRLEEQRTALQDGKDLVFTHRISLARLLGDDPARFAEFLERREAVVRLDERDLLDRTFPGVYRALIQQVDVVGQFAAPISGPLRGIPLTVTHLGESRTRIRRRANPSAPPLTLPECFPSTRSEFVEDVVGEDELVDGLREAFATFEPATIGEYALAFLMALLLGVDDPLDAITGRFKTACRDHLASALGRSAERASCGLVDGEVLVAGTRTLADEARFADALGAILIPPDANDRLDEQPDIEAGLSDLAQLLRADVSEDGAVTAPGLVAVAREAYDGAVAAFRPHIAKWGDATLEEDRDPQVRALGYATLVRRMPAETAVFNLFPATDALLTRAEPARPGSVAPLAPQQSLQYQPMENRGLGGRMLVRLETVGDGGLADQLSDSLTDLVLEVTVRACFDPDLAQTVRSSRSQGATAMATVDALAGSLSVPSPGSVTTTRVGSSELRTVHHSLRAHRDRTVQAWAAAVQAAPGSTSTIAGLLAGTSMLGRDAAFVPLGDVDAFTVELTDDAPGTTEAALLDMADTVTLRPADLGFDPAVLDGRDVIEDAELVSVGIAVIPMPDGVRTASDEPTADPMGVRLRVPPPLDALLPGYATGAPLPQRFKIANDVSDAPTVAELFSSASPTPTMEVAFGEGALASERLYDVLFSLTFRVPVLEVATPATALV